MGKIIDLRKKRQLSKSKPKQNEVDASKLIAAIRQHEKHPKIVRIDSKHLIQ